MRTPTFYQACLHGPMSNMFMDDNKVRELFPDMTWSPKFYNRDRTFFYHPYTLWSAAHHYKIPDLRKEIHADQDASIFVDSGGFQLATGVVKEKNYNDKVALEWSEKNGDIFPILDRPARNKKNQKECIEKTIASAKYYAENRTQDNCSILNVISGSSLKDIDTIYQGVSKYKFEGWAHGAHLNNNKNIIHGLLYLLSKGEYDDHYKYYHVFGVTRFDTVIYLIYLQKLLYEQGINIQIIYDSSTANRMLAFGEVIQFLNIDNATRIKFSNRYDLSKVTSKTKLPCVCPVCSDIRDLRKVLDNSNEFWIYQFLHNLYMMLQHKEIAERLVAFECEDVLYFTVPQRMAHNLKTIKKALEMDRNAGIDYIERNFSDTNRKSASETSLEVEYE